MGGQKKKLPSNCKTVRISKILFFKMEWKGRFCPRKCRNSLGTSLKKKQAIQNTALATGENSYSVMQKNHLVPTE